MSAARDAEAGAQARVRELAERPAEALAAVLVLDAALECARAARAQPFDRQLAARGRAGLLEAADAWSALADPASGAPPAMAAP